MTMQHCVAKSKLPIFLFNVIASEIVSQLYQLWPVAGREGLHNRRLAKAVDQAGEVEATAAHMSSRLASLENK